MELLWDSPPDCISITYIYLSRGNFLIEIGASFNIGEG
jgi:hypothetical protein